ncbi:MAG: isochorismatase family protein [Gemmatimonadetes bacterium]|nr:isochorismatase family protein [Gemmatimonadota bacterium]MBT7860238.1 isochorismatase family protein [Gemmatimonadota bacterium]
MTVNPGEDPALEATRIAIDSVRRYYDDNGIFLERFGFGQHPALVVIDMAYGWTDPAYATGSSRLDEAVEAIQRLLPQCRAIGAPIVYTTSPWRPTDAEEPMHTRDDTTGSAYRAWDERACQIDARLAPEPVDLIIEKENASAFFGTHLAPWLVQHRVDTLLVTGCSTSACVRATATDARAHRFQAIVPRECVQDRAPAAHEWNLFDIDAKFGDVVDLSEVEAYLTTIAPRS